MTFNSPFLILSFNTTLSTCFSFSILLNLNHHQGKLQVDDDDLVKLKVLCRSRVSHFFFNNRVQLISLKCCHKNLSFRKLKLGE